VVDSANQRHSPVGVTCGAGHAPGRDRSPAVAAGRGGSNTLPSDARRSPRAADPEDNARRPLRARCADMLVVPPSARCGPASADCRRPRRRAADPSALALLAMPKRADRHDLHQPCQGAARSESVADRLHLIRRQMVGRVTGRAPPALWGSPSGGGMSASAQLGGRCRWRKCSSCPPSRGEIRRSAGSRQPQFRTVGPAGGRPCTASPSGRAWVQRYLGGAQRCQVALDSRRIGGL